MKVNPLVSLILVKQLGCDKYLPFAPKPDCGEDVDGFSLKFATWDKATVYRY